MTKLSDMSAAQIVADIERLAVQVTGLANQAAKIAEATPKNPIAETLGFYYPVKTAIKNLETARKAAAKVVDGLEKFHLPKKLEAMGLDKVQVPEMGRSFYTLTKYSCSMKDKDAGFEWLRKRGDESLISETVNAGTLATYMKDLVLNEGLEPPEEVFNFNSYDTIGSSKYNPK